MEPGIFGPCAAMAFFVAASVPCLGQSHFDLPFQPESVQLQTEDVKQVLAYLCPDQAFIGKQSGCHGCPRGTSFAGNKKLDLTLGSAIRGHLLSPDSDDLLINTDGCEAHVALDGGSVVFTRSPDGWVASRKYEAVPAGSCRKIRSHRGLDGLLCYQEDGHGGDNEGFVDFHYETGRARVELLSIRDNTTDVCGETSIGNPTIAVESAIERFEFQQDQPDHLTLSIDVKCRNGPLSQQSQKACIDGPLSDEVQIEPGGAFRDYHLDYQFDGETFTLGSSSAESKRDLEACLHIQ